MFIVALFTIAKTWKQPKCPSTEGWKKTIGYVCVCTHACAHAHTLTHTHNGILFGHENEQNNAICSNMEGPRDYHTKSNRERQILYDITLTWNLIF